MCHGRAAGPLPAVPVAVLSHGKPPADSPGMGQMWAALQRDLANEPPDCTHVIVQQSGHTLQGDEPELVTRTIMNLVQQARQRGATQ
jgi:pimeloyl-ACP methyl ester carboxylesterase